METTVKERLMLFIKYKRMNKNSFEKACGLSTGFISNMRVSLQPSKVKSIANVFPDLNTGWLLTGDGEMIKTTNNIAGSYNNIRYSSNGGNSINSNIGVGNMINVSLPEYGTQKIIKPNGEVEISTDESSLKELDEFKREISHLKKEISHLMDNMQLKDDLIASLRDTIELLKHKQ